MNNLKKLGRLWPLFLLIFISVVVLILSLKVILSSDNSEPVNSTLTQVNAVSEESGEIQSPSPVPTPTMSPVSSPSLNEEDTSIPTVVPSTSPDAEQKPAVQTTESPATPQPTEAVVQNVVIDNTIHEYTENYSHTEEGANNEATIATQIIRLVNQERNNNGLGGLSYDENLAYVATVRAMEISSVFSHTRPNGENCFSAFPGGYAYMAENLASADGIISDTDFASGCVKWWMQSEGHRENVLNGIYTNTAVGVYISGGCMYAVQLFGTPQ